MKKWIKVGLLLLAAVAVSVGIYFILRACGVTNIDKLREIIARCGAWGWIAFIALFTTCSTLLCFMPGTSATFIGVSIVMFGAWKGFAVSTISVFLASSLMFFIGNHFGEKAAIKLVGKESLEKAQNLIDVKSKMLLPLMFLFPVFPDDALCMVAGMTKMRYWYFAVVVAIFRTIGIASICFLGSGLINWAELRLTDWFVLINVCVFDIVLIFKYQNKIEKFILHKKKIEQSQFEDANKQVNDVISDRLKGLLQHKENLDVAIAKKRKTLNEKKYCSKEQLNNIQNSIAKNEETRQQVEKKINHILQFKDSHNVGTSAQKEVQEIVCKQIETVMKNDFPDIKYTIKSSTSTVSVYLTLINQNGIEKTIRFSNHDSKTGVSKHNIAGSLTNKSIKKTIQKNLKVLDRKAVIVLLDKIQEERRKNNDS